MSEWGLLTRSTAVWSAHRCSCPRLANEPVNGTTTPTGTSLIIAAALNAAGIGAPAHRASARTVLSRPTLAVVFLKRMDATPPDGAAAQLGEDFGSAGWVLLPLSQMPR